MKMERLFRLNPCLDFSCRVLQQAIRTILADMKFFHEHDQPQYLLPQHYDFEKYSLKNLIMTNSALPDESIPFDGMPHERFVRLLASKVGMDLLLLRILCSVLRLSKTCQITFTTDLSEKSKVNLRLAV
jgi:hypothetical protein